MEKIDFAGWLVSARKGKFTQQQLAKAMGFSRALISNLETGKMLPEAHHVIAAGQALGVDESDLLKQFGQIRPDGVSLSERISKLSPSQQREIESFVEYIEKRKERVVDKPKVTINRETAPLTEAAL